MGFLRSVTVVFLKKIEILVAFALDSLHFFCGFLVIFVVGFLWSMMWDS